MTNEQWFVSLTTEEKAKFLKEVRTKCFFCDVKHYDKTNECPLENCMDLLKWLKQNHEE